MASNEQTKVIEDAIIFMRDHVDEEITTEDLASHVGYSTYHFIRLFKEVTGVTPRHYLSALRIEYSKQILLQSSSSHLKTLLSIGFRSMGSFSSRFKQFVGLSPKSFRQKNDLFISHFEKYRTKEGKSSFHSANKPPYVTCYIESPDTFKGMVFIGLFPRPIPDQRPVVGTAFKETNKWCVFSNVPIGEFYVLAAGIPWGINRKHYFLSKQSLRGKSDRIIVGSDSTIEVKLTLRDPLPTDPPILLNLPHLLFERDRKK